MRCIGYLYSLYWCMMPLCFPIYTM